MKDSATVPSVPQPANPTILAAGGAGYTGSVLGIRSQDSSKVGVLEGGPPRQVRGILARIELDLHAIIVRTIISLGQWVVPTPLDNPASSG